MKKKSFIFTIGAPNDTQYQVLEAMLNHISDHFLRNYEQLPPTMLTSGILNTYTEEIPHLCDITEKEEVTWVTTFCKTCNANVQVAIKNSKIKNAKEYPVSIVFNHRGHGLLLFVESIYKVRGAEHVAISG